MKTSWIPWRARRVTAVAVAALVASALSVASPFVATAGAAAAVPLSTGSNAFGQLGNSAASNRTTPGAVSVPAAVAIASGRDHGYALDEGGAVWAWGENGYGQIGDGTTIDRRTPVKLSLTNVVAIEAGHYNGIALRSDGSVWTWGYGALGQLGLGTTSNRTAPTQVPGLSGVSQVASGRDMSYAIRTNGTVVAWGSNALGEVGDGTTTRRLSPVAVDGLTGIVEISGGRNHALARNAAGTVWAWGDNQYGQIGDGTTTRRLAPVQVFASGVRHVDAGAHHSVAVRNDGVVLTWGRGYRGQLGLGNTANRSAPAVVPGLSGMVEIGDGRDQSFAINAAGEVWAWGQNAAGQLGDGTTTVRSSPVKLSLTGVIAAQSGSEHTLFLPASSTPQANLAPIARITASCAELACSLSGTTSSDSDGTIQEYAWDLGDGATASGATVSHTYAEGTYTVQLTVTDDDGATGGVTRQVTVSSTPPPTSQILFRAGASSTANSTTARVQVPASVQQGDQMLLFVSTAAAATYNAPSGWTLVGEQIHTYRSDMQTRLYTRTATATDAGAFATVALPALMKSDVELVAYDGVDAASPIVSWASAQEPATVAAHAAPPLANSGGGWIVSYWAEKTSTTTDWVGPADQVTRAESFGSGSGIVATLVTDSGAPVATGVWPGRTAVANSAGRKAIMFSVALRPRA